MRPRCVERARGAQIPVKFSEGDLILQSGRAFDYRFLFVHRNLMNFICNKFSGPSFPLMFRGVVCARVGQNMLIFCTPAGEITVRLRC